MSQSLSRSVAAFAEARRAFTRQLEATQGQWNDAARRSFDQQHADHLLLEAQRLGNDLTDLATEAASALAAARSAQ